MTKGNFGHPSQYAGKTVAKYVDIFAELAEGLPKGMRVTDLFGGVGALATRLWPVLEPASWVSIEIDPELVAVYQAPDKAWCVQANAFEQTEFGDLVVIDPHKGTLNAMVKEPQWDKLFNAIARSPAKFILMQEYGAYWCHLPNQKKLYWELFGHYVDKTNYRLVFADYMRKSYDFQVLKHRMGLGSCYYLMEVPR